MANQSGMWDEETRRKMLENRRAMRAGELYYANTPDLMADRTRCKAACREYYDAEGEGASRRKLVEIWNKIVRDTKPLPSHDDALERYPWVTGPIYMDYGYNVKIGEGTFVNCNSTWIDTCTIEVGARTLIGPNCSFYSGSHPLDPSVRNGLKGPEDGKPIKIGDDCWIGGSVTVLPGVTIGRGVTVGAGSVVIKDVPDYVVVGGYPARILKKLEADQEAMAGIKAEMEAKAS